MNVDVTQVVALLTAAFLTVYLFAALLRPEWFS